MFHLIYLNLSNKYGEQEYPTKHASTNRDLDIDMYNMISTSQTHNLLPTFICRFDIAQQSRDKRHSFPCLLHILISYSTATLMGK